MRARAVSKPERSLINKYSNLERYTRSSSIMVSSSIQAIDDTSRYFFLPSNGNGSRVFFSFSEEFLLLCACKIYVIRPRQSEILFLIKLFLLLWKI